MVALLTAFLGTDQNMVPLALGRGPGVITITSDYSLIIIISLCIITLKLLLRYS